MNANKLEPNEAMFAGHFDACNFNAYAIMSNVECRTQHSINRTVFFRPTSILFVGAYVVIINVTVRNFVCAWFQGCSKSFK